MSDQRATISAGFQVETPAVFVRWGTPLADVHKLLAELGASFTDGIVQLKGTALGGLECSMLLHGSREGGSAMRDRLTMISFWKRGDFRVTFDDIQVHLEDTFGPPTETIPGNDDWPAEYKWVLGDIVIGHYADDKGTGP